MLASPEKSSMKGSRLICALVKKVSGNADRVKYDPERIDHPEYEILIESGT